MESLTGAALVHHLLSNMCTLFAVSVSGTQLFYPGATKKLKQVSWECIRKDRFSLTPKGLYDSLVRDIRVRGEDAEEG